MKKVWIASLLILALCLSLAACGDSEPEAVFDPNSVADVLAAHGFSEAALKLGAQDSIEFNEEISKENLVLHSTAAHDVVAKAIYDACKAAADDQTVRDSVSKDPIEFSFEEVEWIRYGYYRNGIFEVLAFSPCAVDQDTGIIDYQFRWE